MKKAFLRTNVSEPQNFSTFYHCLVSRRHILVPNCKKHQLLIDSYSVSQVLRPKKASFDGTKANYTDVKATISTKTSAPLRTASVYFLMLLRPTNSNIFSWNQTVAKHWKTLVLWQFRIENKSWLFPETLLWVDNGIKILR